MKVYVASGSDDRALAAVYMARLKDAGISLTLDWNAVVDAHGGVANRGLAQDIRHRVALTEVHAVEDADVFWLIIPAGASCGCWFEFGAAYTMRTLRDDKAPDLIVSGDTDRSIFTSLAACFPTHEAALVAILGLASEEASKPQVCKAGVGD